jgi:hypothetical protein
MTKRTRKDRPSLTALLPYPNPIDVGGLEARETVIVTELPEAYGLYAARAYRAALALTSVTPWGRKTLDVSEVAVWEEEMLRYREWDEGIWAPLVVIADEMRDPTAANAEMVARACVGVAEWALGIKAVGSALLFGEAAAFVMAGDARYAYVAGRLFKHYGRLTEAKRWLVHARRQAYSNQDLQAQSLALAALDGLNV